MRNSEIEALTEKEVEALSLVHERLTSKQIARRLGISPKSVDKRLDSARVKLGAGTRIDAARRWACDHYGESFPGSPLPVTKSADLGDPDWAETPDVHQRSLGARLTPEEIGPLGRTLVIVGGALTMLVLLLLVLAVAGEVFALLEGFFGASDGQRI